MAIELTPEEQELVNSLNTGEETLPPKPKTPDEVKKSREEEGNAFLDSIGMIGSGVAKFGKEVVTGAMETDPASLAMQSVGGVLDLGQGIINTSYDILDAGENFLHENGFIDDDDYFNPGKATQFAEKLIPPSNNAFESMTRSLVSFAVPYAGIAKIVSGGAKAIKFNQSLIASAAATGLVIDPDGKRLADLAEEVPMLAPLIPDWLTSDEDDSALESRVKNMVEDAGLGTLVAGLATIIGKGIVFSRKARRLREAQEQAQKQLHGEVVAREGVEEGAEVVAREGVEEGAEVVAREGVEEGTEVVAREGVEEGAEVVAREGVEEGATKPVEISIDEREGINRLFGGFELTEKDLKLLKEAKTQEELDQILLKTSQHAEIKKIQAVAKRGKISNEETWLRGQKIYLDKKRFKQVLRKANIMGETLSAEENAAMQLYKSIRYQKYVEAVEKIKGDPDINDINTRVAMVQFDEYQMARVSQESSISEVARSLQFQQAKNPGFNLDDLQRDYLEKYVKFNGGKDRLDMIRETAKIRKLKKPADLEKYFESLEPPSRFEKISQGLKNYYLTNLLSGLGTKGKAIAGNLTYGVMRVGELAIQGQIAPFVKGASSNEVENAFQGLGASLIEAFVETKTFMTSPVSHAEAIKHRFTDNERLFVKIMEKAGIAGEQGKAWNQLVHAIGTIFSPIGSLQSIDKFTGVVGQNSTANQLIGREVRKRGFKPGTVEYQKEFDQLTANPTPEITRGAETGGRRAGLRAEARDVPGIGTENFNVGLGLEQIGNFLDRILAFNVFVPFTNMAANTLDAGIKRVPGLAHLNPQVRQAFEAGGDLKAEAISRQLMGAGVMMGAAFATYQGYVTGSNPSARNLKKKVTGDSRYGEYMVNLGPLGSYKYDHLSPAGVLMSMGADAAEIAALVSEDNYQAWEEVVGAGAALAGQLLVPRGPVEDMQQMLRFILNPSAQTIPISMTGMIPAGAFVRERTKTGMVSADPTRRDISPGARQVEIINGKEVDTGKLAKGIREDWEKIKNKFLDTIGMGEGMPPLLNALGDETAYPPGVRPEYALPMFKHDLKRDDMDPVYKEIYRLAPHEFTPEDEPFREVLQMPPRTMNMGSREYGEFGTTVSNIFRYELTPNEYHDLVLLSSGTSVKGGNFTKDDARRAKSEFVNSVGIDLGGITLKDTLADLFTKKAYKESNDLLKKTYIDMIASGFRRTGQEIMSGLIQSKKIDMLSRMHDRATAKMKKTEAKTGLKMQGGQ